MACFAYISAPHEAVREPRPTYTRFVYTNQEPLTPAQRWLTNTSGTDIYALRSGRETRKKGPRMTLDRPRKFDRRTASLAVIAASFGVGIATLLLIAAGDHSPEVYRVGTPLLLIGSAAALLLGTDEKKAR